MAAGAKMVVVASQTPGLKVTNPIGTTSSQDDRWFRSG
jgi:hypothetical protein